MIGVPGAEAYSEAFSWQDFRLGRPARVASYRGFLFISFNPTVVELVDYLAGAREYLDLICDQSEAGMEIVIKAITSPL